jgi:hypothetical protein
VHSASEPRVVALYCVVLLLLGLLATSWATQSCVSPMLAELVPPRMHNMVYITNRCVGSQSGCLLVCRHGAITVSLYAVCMHGYS